MRIRIHFAKTPAMRFTGHLDLHRAWERMFRRAGLPRVNVAATAESTHSGPPPRIVSPQPKLTYVLHVGDAVKNTIPLEADATAEARQIHWFAGTLYLGASAPSHPLMWKAPPGRWQIQAVDDAGRTARTSVTIVAAQ